MLQLASIIALASSPTDPLTTRLRAIAVDRASFYSCKIAVSVQTATESFAAASDDQVDERFVWGSVTKLLTGAGVLRAVETKKLDLDQPAAPHIDTMLDKLGLPPMRVLFGANASKITPRHLGSMRSGVPDYDTATPFPKPPVDPFRAQVYAQPQKEWDPVDILNVSWVARGNLTFYPGSHTTYSSTNFVLLGLLLAAVHDEKTWDGFDQLSALDGLPAARRAMYSKVATAVHGAPSTYTSLHGYDRTSYNGHNASVLPGTDVYDVKGVYGGWTASDLTARVADVARLAYDIFGAHGPRILAPASVATMLPQPSPRGSLPYGFATFNLTRRWGPSGLAYNQAYGHLGATYGYQSLAIYYPAADISVAVASNIETDDQAQPADAICYVYNAVLSHLHNTTEPTCQFHAQGYYGGWCDCGNNYSCNSDTKTCEMSEMGTLSKADCEAAC